MPLLCTCTPTCVLQRGELANRILSVGSMDRALLIADNLEGPEGEKFQHLSGRGFLTITGVWVQQNLGLQHHHQHHQHCSSRSTGHSSRSMEALHGARVVAAAGLWAIPGAGACRATAAGTCKRSSSRARQQDSCVLPRFHSSSRAMLPSSSSMID